MLKNYTHLFVASGVVGVVCVVALSFLQAVNATELAVPPDQSIAKNIEQSLELNQAEVASTTLFDSEDGGVVSSASVTDSVSVAMPAIANISVTVASASAQEVRVPGDGVRPEAKVAKTAKVPDTSVVENNIQTQPTIPVPSEALLVKESQQIYASSVTPARLIIPSISVNAPVVSMGLTPEGKMAVPDNYTEIGWYNGTVKPGEKGSAVMGAHVDNGGSIPGVFKKLRQVSVGDEIFVVGVGGEKVRFIVRETKYYNFKTQAPEVFFANDTERLNLITCAGNWLPKINNYDSRLIVFAERVLQ